MKKLICTLAALVLTCTAAVSCGEKENEESSHGNMVGGESMPDDYSLDGADMPYGATITELRPDRVKIMVSFDSRFFDEEEQVYPEITLITDCIAGINTNDHELLKSCYYPGYMDYAAEKSGAPDADAYIDGNVNSFASSLGEGFEITYIDISNCSEEDSDTRAGYFNDVDKSLKEAVGGDILDKVTSRRVVEIGGDTTYKTTEGEYRLTNHSSEMMICVYKIDGKYYLF